MEIVNEVAQVSFSIWSGVGDCSQSPALHVFVELDPNTFGGNAQASAEFGLDQGRECRLPKAHSLLFFGLPRQRTEAAARCDVLQDQRLKLVEGSGEGQKPGIFF